MEASAEDTENALIERVFFRIGSAATDDEFQVALSKFLTPLILKLNSPSENVRTKVLELLTHIKTRLKSRGQVKLPLDALLTQFQDPQATPFITNFTILFIKLGFPRLEPARQAELVPLLINCLEGKSASHRDSVLQLLLLALQHVKMPGSEADCRTKFPLKDRPVIKKLLLDYFMDVLLLPYNFQGPPRPQGAESGSNAGGAEGQLPVPPGLSSAAVKRLTFENPLSVEELEKVKLSIINFLSSGVVDESDIACHLVVASADTRHSVSTSGDMSLKKIMGSVDWNSKEILGKLFSIFQGTVIVKGQQAPVSTEDRRSPVDIRIRLKIFPLLLKAREAGNMFPASLQLVFECLFGPTPNNRLRTLAVEFVHHVVLHCDDVKFSKIDVVLLNGMLKVIGEAKEDPKLRSLAYVAVGKIGRRSPNRLRHDFQVVQTLFEAICQEEGDVRLAVQESLSLMTEAFSSLDQTNQQLLEALLLQSIDKEEPQARLVAVQYAASVFPDDHLPSRYVLMLGAGDVKEDIRDESVKALRRTPTSLGASKKMLLPDFVEMVRYVAEKAQQRRTSQHRHVVVNTVLPFNPASYSEIVIYLRMCLSQSAGVPVLWEVESLMEHAPIVATKVKSLLQENGASQEKNGPIQLYVAMLQELSAVSTNPEIIYCLLEAVAMVPDMLAPKLALRLDWIKSLLSSSKDEVKQYAAELYATVCFYSRSRSEFTKEVEDLLKILNETNSELILGAVLALGFFVGRLVKCLRNGDTTGWGNTSEVEMCLTRAVKTIAAFLNHNNISFKTHACSALGEIGRNGPLPLPAGVREGATSNNNSVSNQVGTVVADDVKEAKRVQGEVTDQVTKMSVINSLVAMIKTSNETVKTKEKAAACLGDVCVGDSEYAYRKEAIEELVNAIQSKQVELQLTIGQTLVDMAMGPSSPRARCIWTTSIQEHQKATQGVKDEVAWLLQQLLTKYVDHANPHMRQGACIWLLTLIRQAGHHPALKESLPDIQRGFMRLLSENDEITQDFASKGLGLVMEVCSPEQKDSLVSELVETLMTGKRTKTTVSADTTVFQGEALGKAPDGGSLSTYKELCAIATDLNQPDLIYKFMHLANHNATWNARKGAAVGFSTIMAQAGEQLAPYLTQIVPKLYRYQFDPNPRIQQAMSSIWSALVQDNKKTVDTYLKQILEDLLKNLTSNQWRVRESSCVAVSNLLRGRVLDNIIEDIPELWEICLRVRDDIKESVRLAADQACQVLSKVSIKICDVNNGKVGEKAISLVLPCLLRCAVHSNVKEVRAIGLTTILEISRNAGALLKPVIAVLVPTLLEATSGLEPEMLNYLSLQLGSQAGQDKLDSVRISASKSSPMMETVNRCVQYVDSNSLPELVPRLVELIKGGIGVSTKAGCSSFIVSLVYQCPQDLSPYSGKLLAAFLHGLNSRNAAERKAYATAIGHLVKISKDASVEKLLQKLKSWYLESEGTNACHACCITLHAIAKSSSDILQRHANLVMPLAFFAMHEDKKKEKDTKKIEETTEWEDVWNEITPGMETAIRLYLVEIVALLSVCLQSTAWPIKAQAARAVQTVASKLQHQLTQPHLGDLLTLLVDGLSGRTWDGKETLLKALSSICTSCRNEIEKAEKAGTLKPSLEQITAVLLKECGKERREYKMAAMQSLGPVLELYHLDQFSSVLSLVGPLISQSSSDEDQSETSLTQRQDLIIAAWTLLGEAWPSTRSSQELYTDQVKRLLSSSLAVSPWKVQVVILQVLYKFLDRLAIFQKDELANHEDKVRALTSDLITVVSSSMENNKYVALRKESLSLVNLIVHRLSDSGNLSFLPESLQPQLRKELHTLAESGPWELREKAKELVTLLSDSSLTGVQAMEH